MTPDYDFDCRISSQYSQDESLTKVIDRLISARKAIVASRTDGHALLKLGSKTWFRIWGLVATPKSRYPMTVSINVEPARLGSEVKLIMQSDPGRYAYSLPAVGAAYQKAFRSLNREITETLNGSH